MFTWDAENRLIGLESTTNGTMQGCSYIAGTALCFGAANLCAKRRPQRNGFRDRLRYFTR